MIINWYMICGLLTPLETFQRQLFLIHTYYFATLCLAQNYKQLLTCALHSQAPFTRKKNAYIFMRFGLSFTQKLRFYHGKRSFLKTPAKVEISENSVFVFACALA